METSTPGQMLLLHTQVEFNEALYETLQTKADSSPFTHIPTHQYVHISSVNVWV